MRLLQLVNASRARTGSVDPEACRMAQYRLDRMAHRNVQISSRYVALPSTTPRRLHCGPVLSGNAVYRPLPFGRRPQRLPGWAIQGRNTLNAPAPRLVQREIWV